jgi:hypothetical protein
VTRVCAESDKVTYKQAEIWGKNKEKGKTYEGHIYKKKERTTMTDKEKEYAIEGK